MGFFKNMLRRASGMPTDSEVSRSLNNLRDRVHTLQAMAIAMDAENDSSDDLSLFVFLRMDLLSFSLHIAQSDNVLEQKEVDAINVFLGMDMSFAQCKMPDALIATYEQLGIVIASIDGDFDARERRDLDDYISMLKRYAARF